MPNPKGTEQSTRTENFLQEEKKGERNCIYASCDSILDRFFDDCGTQGLERQMKNKVFHGSHISSASDF